jgi:glycosyltransferase involved in cell wall biosynthesis
VAIPTYNRPELLRETLASVLAQSLQDFEVLVVDNASPYDAAALVDSFHDTRIQLRRQPRNVGMHYNQRAALCTPTTRYVAYLEDDNLWLPHHLREAVDALEQHPEAPFYSCTSALFGREDRLVRPFWCTGDTLEASRWQDVGYAAWLRGCPVMASSVVLRRDALEGLFWGGRSWPWCNDWLWWGQLVLRGPLAFNPRIGVRVRYHASNASNKFASKRGEAHWLYVIRELAKRAYAAGGLRDLATETREFPASALSVLVIALSAPDSPPDLVRQARRIFEARRDLATQPGCALNFRLATRLGGWWLRWADPQTRLLARWWPVARSDAKALETPALATVNGRQF